MFEINKDVIKQVLEINFDRIIIDLDALNEYYEQTKQMIDRSRNENTSKYAIGNALSILLDEAYEKEPSERSHYLDEINEKELPGGVLVREVANFEYDSEKEMVSYVLKGTYQTQAYDPKNARRQKQLINNQEIIFIRAILSNIVILFEDFLSALYGFLLLLNPTAYLGDKTIPACDLLSKEVQEIISGLFQREIESNMYDSLKVLDKINKISGINADRYLSIRKDFEEIYYRRNAYVHTNGRANATYLEKVDKAFLNEIKKDDKLVCDSIYLDNAILTLYKMLISLQYEVLNKIEAKQEEYDSIANLGFSALQNGNYYLAEYVYDLLKRNRGFEHIYRAMYEVNYINAKKLQREDVSKLLERFDVSIATDDYKIAKECLYDHHENVYRLLTESYPKSFTADHIREWPIFIKFRETEYYKRFVNEHQSDFEKVNFEKESGEIEKIGIEDLGEQMQQ